MTKTLISIIFTKILLNDLEYVQGADFIIISDNAASFNMALSTSLSSY